MPPKGWKKSAQVPRTPTKKSPAKRKRNLDSEDDDDVKYKDDDGSDSLVSGTAGNMLSSPSNKPKDAASQTNSAASTPGVHPGPPVHLKAIKARQRAIADKIAAVQDLCQSELPKDQEVVVDCTFIAQSEHAPLDRSKDYVHMLKLRSDNPFYLIKQTMLTEGPYAGSVAVVLKQTLPLSLLKLDKRVRTKILKYLLKHDEETVNITFKQGRNRTVVSPAYGEENIGAILATNKQLQAEAAKILYGQKYHFAGTQVISTFLLIIGSFRKYLRTITSDTYSGASARVMWPLLEGAKKLTTLHFKHISSNQNPKTAVMDLYKDGTRWFSTLDKSNPLKGMGILDLEKSAFHKRIEDQDGSKVVVQWDDDDMALFWEGLKTRLENAALARKARY